MPTMLLITPINIGNPRSKLMNQFLFNVCLADFSTYRVSTASLASRCNPPADQSANLRATPAPSWTSVQLDPVRYPPDSFSRVDLSTDCEARSVLGLAP